MKPVLPKPGKDKKETIKENYSPFFKNECRFKNFQQNSCKLNSITL
jgi:hypothetical protein